MCVDYYPFGMLLPNRHASSDKYRYGFQGQEKDDELKGEGNSYDFGARMYDNRIGRWFSRDAYEKKYVDYSPYVFALNSVILFNDPDGNEPVKPKVSGLKAFIKKIISKEITSLVELRNEYKNDYIALTQEDGVGGRRYLYSTRWGWVDIKHFSAAAEGADRFYVTGNMVLKKGEQIERDQAGRNNGSAYAYEDLPSNILGVYFEEFLENDKTTTEEFKKLAEELDFEFEESTTILNRTGTGEITIKDNSNLLALRLYKYFKQLGFVDNPEDFEDFKKIASGKNDATSTRGLKNFIYLPSSDTVEESLNVSGIDARIIRRIAKLKKRSAKKSIKEFNKRNKKKAQKPKTP